MNTRRFFMGMLVLAACCLFLVPVRTVFADETMTHIEGTVSFDDDNNSRGLRPDSVPVIVATRIADEPSYGELDFGGTKTQKLCYVSDATNWKYDADIPLSMRTVTHWPLLFPLFTPRMQALVNCLHMPLRKTATIS